MGTDYIESSKEHSVVHQDTLEYLADNTRAKIVKIDDKYFCVDQNSARQISIKEDKPKARQLLLNSLQAVVDYLLSGPDKLDSSEWLIKCKASKVSVLSVLDGDRDRECLVVAEPADEASINNIAEHAKDFRLTLRQRFHETDGMKKLESYTKGLISIREVATEHDGVKTQSVVKSESGLRGKADIQNPISLQPRVGFPEVTKQVPEREFFLTVKETNQGDFSFGLDPLEDVSWGYEIAKLNKEYLSEKLGSDWLVLA